MKRLLFYLLLSLSASPAAIIEYFDGLTIKLNPNGTSAGLNVGSHPSDPSALNNGDVWYNSTSNALKARIGGATVSLGSGGSGGTWGSITGTLGDQTDVQAALDARQPLADDLTAIAALTTTAYGRGLLDDANASDARSTLGLGTMATAAATDYLPLAGAYPMTGAITFSGTDHPGIRLNNLTTTQRNAMTPLAGYTIWNTTSAQVEAYTGGEWAAVGSGATSSITGTPIFPGADVDTLIAGLTASSTTKNVYSTQDHVTPTYVRNASLWATGIDLTCASPWNNQVGWDVRGAGTAITPRHIVFAEHYTGATGSAPWIAGVQLRFITAGNVVVTRTLSAMQHVAGTDICIGLLDSDLPDSIKPALLLPDDYAHWLTAAGCAVAGLDQEEKLLVADIASMNSTLTTIAAPADAQRLAFNEAFVAGDSGNPLFIFPHGKTVLLGCFAGSTTAPSLIADNRAGVLAAIATLGAYGHVPMDVNLDLAVVAPDALGTAAALDYSAGGLSTDAGKLALYDADKGLRAMQLKVYADPDETDGTVLYSSNDTGGFNPVYLPSEAGATLATTTDLTTLNADNLTAGTVAVARGGTGLASGTSGGILAFTAAGTIASSGALAANALLIGGGAGVAPSAITTGAGVVTALGVNTGSAGAVATVGGTIGAATATTPSVSDNDTSVATTAFVQGERAIVTKNTAASYTIGTTDARELYGGVIYVTGAATITIPAVAAGASFTVITIGAIAVSVDPNAADAIYLNGSATPLSDGDKITNASLAGDMAVFTYYDATGWVAMTNSGWTDGN